MPSITPYDLIKIQKLAGDSQKAIDDFMDLQDIMMEFDMNNLQKLQEEAFDKAFNDHILRSDKILLATNIKTLTDILDKIIEKLDSEGIRKAERLCRDGITNVLTQPIFVRVITPFFQNRMKNLFEKLKLLLSFVLEHKYLEEKNLNDYVRYKHGHDSGAEDNAQIFKLRKGLKQINNAMKELGKALVKKRPLFSFTSDKSALQKLVEKQKEKFEEIILDSQVKQIIAKLDELFKKASESSGDQDEEMLTLEICRIDGSNLPQCATLVKNLELRYKELDYKNKIPDLEEALKSKNARKEGEDKNKDKLTKEDLTYKGQDYLTQLNILADIKDKAEKKVAKQVQVESEGQGGKRRKKRKTNKRKSRKRKKKTIRKRRNKTKKNNKKRTRKRRKRHK
tara:strand:+ start:1621 stop:2805 length:1185 start_codon:yes stop_codon:yes gene_type:complete